MTLMEGVYVGYGAETGQTVVPTLMVSVVRWGPAGQSVTVAAQEVTVYVVAE